MQRATAIAKHYNILIFSNIVINKVRAKKNGDHTIIFHCSQILFSFPLFRPFRRISPLQRLPTCFASPPANIARKNPYNII